LVFFLGWIVIPNLDYFDVQEAEFAIFGIICLLGVLFIRAFIPKTHGRILEKIEKIGKKRLAE
jgi:hypothetical protein